MAVPWRGCWWASSAGSALETRHNYEVQLHVLPHRGRHFWTILPLALHDVGNGANDVTTQILRGFTVLYCIAI